MKIIDECKQYINDIRSNWLRKSRCLECGKYLLVIAVLAVISSLSFCCDNGVIVGLCTGIGATLAIKISESNRELHITFLRTRAIVQNFIWIYETANTSGVRNIDVEHTLRNLYDDMLLEASRLCSNDTYVLLSKSMFDVLDCCSKKTPNLDKERQAFEAVKNKYEEIFK